MIGILKKLKSTSKDKGIMYPKIDISITLGIENMNFLDSET
jgi:hypothetical protein